MLDIISPGYPPRTLEFMGDRFELSGFPVGPSLIVVSAEGLKGSRYLHVRNEERTTVDIPVYPPVSLTGRLVDAVTGQPTRGAVSIPLFAEIWTEEDGSFVFRGAPAGESFLTVNSDPPSSPRRVQRIAAQLVKLAPDQDNDLGNIAVPAP